MRLLPLYAVFFFNVVLTAQPEPSDRTTARAHGDATVSSKPDQVTIDIGVITQAPTAQAAGAQNAKQVSDVIAELKKAAGTAAQIQTTQYSLQPNYKYSKDGGSPSIVSYSANNTVQVKSSDLAGVGKVIDAATRVGANNIHGISFGLKDDQSARAEALRQATAQAHANVVALAAAVNKRIQRIIRIEDREPIQVRPVRMEMMRAQVMADAAAPTPVEPGNIQVRATVTLTAELTQ